MICHATFLTQTFLLFTLIVTPSVSSEHSNECGCGRALNDRISTLKNELLEANKIIQNLIESNRKLRIELQSSSKFEDNKIHSGQKVPSDGGRMIAEQQHLHLIDDNEVFVTKINGWDEDADETNEFVYGLPSLSLEQRKIVIELGANNGEWIRSFLASNPDYWPLIVEPQPIYRDVLREIAMEVIFSLSY
jgi:hypothetical protein